MKFRFIRYSEFVGLKLFPVKRTILSVDRFLELRLDFVQHSSVIGLFRTIVNFINRLINIFITMDLFRFKFQSFFRFRNRRLPLTFKGYVDRSLLTLVGNKLLNF